MGRREQYQEAFEAARERAYPMVAAFERTAGYAVDRDELEAAARILACPLKVNPPNWQHGRIIYAAAREYMAEHPDETAPFLDIGTAKGFSACVMSWAIRDAKQARRIDSIDVMDPELPQLRNSVAEVDGPITLQQFVEPFVAPGVEISFHGDGSAYFLTGAVKAAKRIGFAFVDGKHQYEAVRAEIKALDKLQLPGDVIVFDDMQIEPVGRAVENNLVGYDLRTVKALGERIYGVALKL
jgi:predicted O-methyltransferase YrrM